MAGGLVESRSRAPHGADPGTVAAGRECDAWAVLAGVHGLGPVAFGVLLGRYGSGVAILREASSPGGPERLAAAGDSPRNGSGVAVAVPIAVADAIAEAAQTAAATLARIRELGLRVVTLDDPVFPARLAAIEMPPHVLYVLGDPAAMNARAAIAIVGTRRPTDAGRSIASRLAANLAAVGASVVSGLAVGIDGAAHSAAVHAHGTTVAVIGSGLGAIHPRVHDRLAASIVAAGGAIVSELGPDVAPSKGTFPRRNRIISGLTDATVVVEAPARSGALITASWALEQGRECFLVPGSIDAPASAGCLAFLREFPTSARIVAGIPQLIDDLGLADHLTEPGVSRDAAATLSGVGEAAARLGRELVKGRATVDELVAATGWPVASVLAGLTLLERRGLAVGVHGRFRPAGGLAGVNPRTARQRPRVSRP
ncbi:MAG: DNA-processing protein DprA [Chloroflexota bacterium]